MCEGGRGGGMARLQYGDGHVNEQDHDTYEEAEREEDEYDDEEETVG